MKTEYNFFPANCGVFIDNYLLAPMIVYDTIPIMKNVSYAFILFILLLAAKGNKDEMSDKTAVAVATTRIDSARRVEIIRMMAFAELSDERADYRHVQLPHDTLPKTFVPKNLTQIPTTKNIVPVKPIMVCGNALPQLNKMGADFLRAMGRPLQIVSGYRSFDYQAALYNHPGARESHSVQYPGLSQHQTGLAFDMVGTFSAVGTPDLKWLNENAWRYGFVVSYTQETMAETDIMAEPWHFLYVGRETAAFIQKYFTGSQYEYLKYLSLLRARYGRVE